MPIVIIMSDISFIGFIVTPMFVGCAGKKVFLLTPDS